MSAINTEEPLKIVTEGEYRGVGIEVDVVSIPFLDDVDEDEVRGVFAVNSSYIAVNQDDQRFEVSLDMDGQNVNVIHIPDHIDILTVKRWNQGGSGEFTSVEGGLDKYPNGTQVYLLVDQAIAGAEPDHLITVFNENGSGKFSDINGVNNLNDGTHLYINTVLEPKLSLEEKIAKLEALHEEAFERRELAAMNPDNKFIQEKANQDDAILQQAMDDVGITYNNEIGGYVMSDKKEELGVIEAKTQSVSKYFNQLSGRMMAERAKDLSDEEINRTLSETTLSKFCIDAVTHLRDHDGLTIDKVYGSWATMANRFYESAVESTLYNHPNGTDISQVPFQKLTAPNLITDYQELVSRGNDVTEKRWKEFVELHVQRDVTPDKFFALMHESSALEIEIAKGQDTPQIDARLREIDEICERSGLEYDMDTGRVTPFDIHALMIEKGVPYFDSDEDDGKLRIEYLNYPITPASTDDEIKHIAEHITEKYFNGDKKYFHALEAHITESKMLIENTEKTLDFLNNFGVKNASESRDESYQKPSAVLAKDTELTMKVMGLKASVSSDPENEVLKDKLARAKNEYAGFTAELDDSVRNFHTYQAQAATSDERYMVLSITNTENAAFIDVGRKEEIARILVDTANNLPAASVQKDNILLELPLRDLNGNTVGDLKLLAKNEDQYGFRIIGSKFQEELDHGTVRLIAAVQKDELLESAESILRTAADQLIQSGSNEFNVRDVNGNSIGKFTYQEPASLINENHIDMKAALDKGSVYLGDDSVSDYTSEGFRFVVTGGDYEFGYYEEPDETVVVNALGEIAPDDGNASIREINLSKLNREITNDIREVSSGNMALDAFEKKHYPSNDDDLSM